MTLSHADSFGRRRVSSRVIRLHYAINTLYARGHKQRTTLFNLLAGWHVLPVIS